MSCWTLSSPRRPLGPQVRPTGHPFSMNSMIPTFSKITKFHAKFWFSLFCFFVCLRCIWSVTENTQQPSPGSYIRFFAAQENLRPHRRSPACGPRGSNGWVHAKRFSLTNVPMLGVNSDQCHSILNTVQVSFIGWQFLWSIVIKNDRMYSNIMYKLLFTTMLSSLGH